MVSSISEIAHCGMCVDVAVYHSVEVGRPLMTSALPLKLSVLQRQASTVFSSFIMRGSKLSVVQSMFPMRPRILSGR